MRSAWLSATEEISSELSEASKGNNRVYSKETPETNDKQTYIQTQLVLYDLTSKYYESLIDGKVPGVEFKIKNNGDRTLSRVDVTIYFKDATDVVVFEKNYTPVLADNQSIIIDGDPLKPGYIWQLERGKFYPATDVPTEWDEGNVEAEITRVEFAAVAN
jgi:hypothetical protein